MPSEARGLLVVGYAGIVVPDELLDAIAHDGVGGIILFARNLGSLAETAGAVEALGRAAPPGPPLIVTVDQEGGRVQRLKDPPFTRWPPMRKVGTRGDEAVTEQVGRALGEELRAVGFNVDLAPSLDVDTNPKNPVIGDRAFSSDPAEVARQGLAFWRGLESAGVRGCGKHFPGHGDTVQDSHLELPRLDAPWECLEKVELVPFAEAARAGVPLIMTAHVVFSAVDTRPATLSPAWIEGVLRRRLGFKGVVVSDDLDMQAVADNFSVEEVVREGLAAGVDLFLACRNPERQRAAAAALEEAARDARLGPRVAEALARVRAFRATLRPAAPDPSVTLPNPEHQRLAASF
jgi:beta-N-acetylhexosaminidase